MSAKPSLKEVCDWWGRLPEDERMSQLSETFAIDFAFNSGKIENDSITLHDTREIFTNGRVTGFTGELRTLFEIENSKNAWSKALDMSASPSPVTLDDLLDIQRILTRGTYDERRWALGERPGTFKEHDFVVANEIGLSPSQAAPETARLIDQVAARFRRCDAPTAFSLACYAHASLVDIHPFADGNGRTSRMLHNILLMKSGLPPLLFEESQREAYYGALDLFHYTRSLKAFVSLAAAEAGRTWQKAMGRASAAPETRCAARAHREISGGRGDIPNHAEPEEACPRKDQARPQRPDQNRWEAHRTKRRDEAGGEIP